MRILLSGIGVASVTQSRHDRRWVSIDYRRGRSNPMSRILCNRVCFKTSS